MESRGKRILNLVTENDRKLLEAFNQPSYESTKGVDLHLVDVNILRSCLKDYHTKPVAVVTPQKRIEEGSNRFSPIQQRHVRNLSQVSDDVEPISISTPYALRNRNSNLRTQFSDPISEPEPFTDSPSIYSPSGSTSSSLSSVISHDINSTVQEKYQLQPHSNDTIVSSSSKSDENFDVEIKKQDPIVLKTNRNYCIKKSQNVPMKNRVRDKEHCCYFWQKILCNNLSRHIEKMHGNEIEVAKIFAMQIGSRKRRDALQNIIKYGDFYHNCEVLATKCGDIIVTRRPSLQEEINYAITDYGPCPECLGFYLKKHIWYHLKYKCTVKLEKNFKEINKKFTKGAIYESAALLNGILSKNFSPLYTEKILNCFKNDKISDTCKTDKTILRFGAFLFEKYGCTQTELIRQSMRQLGRLTLQMKNEGQVFEQLNEMFVPKKFDAIVTATKALCKTEEGSDQTKRPEFDIPSLALKIGYGIKKCAAIERGQSLRKGDLKRNKSIMSFLDLMNLEWSVRISSNALLTLYTRKHSTSEDFLPVTSDLLKLNKFLEDKINYIKKNLSAQNYMQLISLTLSRIILFNKRRSGETAKITLAQFAARPDWKNMGTEEIKNSLTPFELKLASSLTIIKVAGKRGRIVPILLTKDMKETVMLLISKRVEFGTSCENPYIFAIPNSTTSHLRGHNCLKKWCTEADLESPELITSTKLRKYVATVCQIFDLTENGYDWLARHLGHDVRVHREFYRLQENAVELAKVSRLLIAVDQGEAHRFAGKQLAEINIEDIENIQEVNESGEASDSEEEILEKEKSIEADKSSQKEKRSTKKKNSKKISIKRPWTEEEKQVIFSEFKQCIKKKSLPRKQQCMEVIKKYSIFTGRKWTDIKFYVKNYYTRVNKLKSTLENI